MNPAFLIAGAQLVLGAISSYSAGQSQRNAAIASNKETKKLNKAQYERDTEVWEIDYLNSLVSHAYKLAENEALRYKDDVKRADYEKQQNNIINAALQNLGLNTDALTDQYVVAEDIRYNDELRNLMYQTGTLGFGRRGDMLKSGLQSAQSSQQYMSNRQTSRLTTQSTIGQARGQYQLRRAINNQETGNRIQSTKNTRDFQLREQDLNAFIRNSQNKMQYRTDKANNNLEAAVTNRQAMEQVAQYMNAINSNKIQADLLLAQKENEGANIQEQIVLGEAIDTMARDAEYLSAMGESATRRAVATARSGGSRTAAKASLDAMQAMGRTYGQMRAEQAQRRQRMTDYNASLVGETAERFAQFANQAEGIEKQIEGTKNLNSLRNEGYKVKQASLDAYFDLASLTIDSQQKLNKYGIKQQASDEIRALLSKKQTTNRTYKFDRDVKIGNARLTNQLNQAGYKSTNFLTQYGARKSNRLGAKQYQFNLDNQLNTFNNSVIPGFGLAQNAGQRTLNALYQNTFNRIDQAATPFREAIILDDPQPIAGLAPNLTDGAKVYVPSSGSILRNTFVSTAQQALGQFSTGPDGNLRWGAL